jgi:RNA polymerase primary sigma factor
MEQAEAIAGLLERGKASGSVTAEDVDEAVENGADVEAIHEALLSKGIKVLEEEDEPEEKAAPIEEASQVGDPVRMYLRSIGKVKLLTAEDEVRLAKAYEAGREADGLLEGVLRPSPEKLRELAEKADLPADPRLFDRPTFDHVREMLHRIEREGILARRKLIEANLRLVVSIAKKYAGRGMTLLDLVQEGNLGLIRAVEKFDWSKGFKFSTYATWWIRQAITRAIADQARTIRVPVHMVDTINKLTRTSRRMLQELGREPTDEELAVELELPPERIREIRMIAREPVSLESPVGDEDDASLADFVEDPDAVVPLEAASVSLLQAQLREAMDTLTPREREIIELRFGLADGHLHTLEEVGVRFNVTRERVRQIESKTLSKLRHPSRTEGLRDYLE